MTDLNLFEQVWSQGPEARRLVATRNDDFDFRSGLFHAPITYQWESLPSVDKLHPSRDETLSALKAFVRDEFGSRTAERPLPDRVQREVATCSLRERALAYQAWAEQRRVYDSRMQARLADLVSGEAEPRHRLHQLLAFGPIAARENRRNFSLDEFESSMLAKVDLRVGARLIAMGLPFRDQNPFRTADLPESVSMGEVAFLVSLHVAALELYQVFPSGSTATVVADGRFYAEVLGVDVRDAGSYLHNVRRLRNDLNMQGTVSIIDLQEVVDRFSSRRSAGHIFDDSVGEIEATLKQLVATDDTAQMLLASVIRGLRWNYATRSAAIDVVPEDFWAWLHGSEVEGAIFVKLDGQIEAAALRYTAMNLALRFHDVVSTMLPGFIRASVHPKPLQVGLARLGSVSAWNGVAYVEKENFEALRVMPLHEVPNHAREFRSNDYGPDSVAFYG